MNAQVLRYEDIKQLYPGENAVHLKHSKQFTLDLKDGKVMVEAEITEETMALDDIGIQFANTKRIYSNSFVKSRIKEANTLSPKKSGSYKKINATDIVDKADISEHVFFDDNRSTIITYPVVTIGSVTRLQSLEEYTDPHLAGQFFFSSYVPSLESELVIKAHNRIQIRYMLRNCTEKDVEFVTEQKGRYTYYKWRSLNRKKYSLAENAPTLRHYEPHVIFYISDYVNEKDTVKLLSTSDELYQWYAEPIRKISSTPSKALKAHTDSLVTGCTTEMQKVTRILYWVQDHIKYIAFEDGMGGFIPREPNAIFEKRYGDCKDMASIITQMMSLCGVKGYLAWIGTRNIPYTFTEVPCPFSTDHMIAAYKDSAGKVWLLDATGKNAPIGLYTSMIQGKQALIGIDSARYELYNVPVVPAERNQTVDSVSVQLEGGVVRGEGKKYLHGYPKVFFDHMHTLTTAARLKERLTAGFAKGNNTFEISRHDVRHAANRDSATVINYAFSISNYTKEHQDEIFINLHLDKSELKYLIAETRGDIPLEFEYTLSETSVVKARTPGGYQVEYLPADASFTTPDFGFTIKYRKSGQEIILEKHFYCNHLILQPKDFKDWSQMLDQLSKSYNESIIFKKT